MSGFQGADIEQMLTHGDLTEVSGQRLGEMAEELVSNASGLSWAGPDADAFHEQLTQQVASTLREVGGKLGAGARALAQHAAQQDLASDPDGSSKSWGDDPIAYMSIYEQAAINHLGPDYESVIADTPVAGLELITGETSGDDSFFGGNPSIEEFESALAENRPITVMSDPIHPWRSDISAAHVYQVQGVDPDSGELILVNPWGNSGESADDMTHTVQVSIEDYNANFVMAGVGAKPDKFGGD